MMYYSAARYIQYSSLFSHRCRPSTHTHIYIYIHIYIHTYIHKYMYSIEGGGFSLGIHSGAEQDKLSSIDKEEEEKEEEEGGRKGEEEEGGRNIPCSSAVKDRHRGSFC